VPVRKPRPRRRQPVQETDIEARKRFSRFGPEDAGLLAGIREPLSRHVESIVDAFYQHLLEQEPLRRFLSDPDVVKRLRRLQSAYLLSLTREDHGDEYVADRLRIGRTHERIGLRPQWYLGSYGILLDQMVPMIVEHYPDDPDRAARTTIALTKLFNLDSQIVLDAYFETRQQKAVARSERLAAVGELAASIAHEVRNPLAGMKGAMEMLRRPLSPDDPKQEVMTEVIAQIERLEVLVRDLLTFARPHPVNRGPMKLHELLERALRLSLDGGEHDDIAVVRDYGPGSASLQADPQQLEQVFLNLIHNAIHSMEEGGTLTLTARADGSMVRVSIQDSGEGIPPEDLPHIFQPFYTTKHRGSGLGLSIVKKIVDAHDGTIDVDSKPGEGTTMTVSLPRTGND
jgi:signal transduction histidine kinase